VSAKPVVNMLGKAARAVVGGKPKMIASAARMVASLSSAPAPRRGS
jgi:hypothetical protein